MNLSPSHHKSWLPGETNQSNGCIHKVISTGFSVMSAKKSYRFNELYGYTNMILLPLDYWTLMYWLDVSVDPKKGLWTRLQKGRDQVLLAEIGNITVWHDQPHQANAKDYGCLLNFCTFSLNKRAEIFLKPVQTSGVHTDINPKNTGTMGPLPSPPELCFAWSNRTIQMSRSGRIRLSCIRSLKVHSRVTERTPWEHNKCPSSSANMQQQ